MVRTTDWRSPAPPIFRRRLTMVSLKPFPRLPPWTWCWVGNVRPIYGQFRHPSTIPAISFCGGFKIGAIVVVGRVFVIGTHTAIFLFLKGQSSAQSSQRLQPQADTGQQDEAGNK